MKNPNAPHIARLQAIMDVFGFGQRGGQTEFAKVIGVDPDSFSMVMTGTDLSKRVAFAIKKRFRISLDFLWDGDPGALNVHLYQRLLEWERKTGRRIFAPEP
jgi:hypothetical protein